MSKSVKLVKMERDGKSADVHPDEVENYSKFGWVKKVVKNVKRKSKDS